MMPEKIWADYDEDGLCFWGIQKFDEKDTEYIRADVHEAEVARLNKLLNQSEVERKDWKRWTHEREDIIEKLNKALEQMHKLVLTRYDSRFEVAPDGTSDIYGVEYFDDGEATYNERLPELALWLRNPKEKQ